MKMKEEKELIEDQKLFLAMIGHDLRSPLNSILGVNEILEDTPLNAEQRDYLKLQNRACMSLLNLVNNLLELQKLEKGQFIIERSQMDFKEVLDNIYLTLLIQAKAKGIELRFNTDTNIPSKLLGDSLKISQIITNLVSNAIKFTEKGFVEISSTIKRSTKKKVVIEIIVKDSGMGIKEKSFKNIFVPYVQENEQIKKVYGGFGLGLSITKMFIEKMKGKVDVKSEWGEGTEFTLEIPFLISPEDDTTDVKTMIAFEQLPENYLDIPLNILIADDTLDNQILTRAFLKGTMIMTDFAEDGVQAFEMFKIKNYDLLLLDIQMPIMNGLECVKQIRRYEKDNSFEPKPIIAFTANAFKDQIEDCYSAGFNNYISKPVKKDTLIRSIYKTILYNEE